MFDRYPPKSVVVGVDGSAAAIRAARWAVDEGRRHRHSAASAPCHQTGRQCQSG